jgi:tetratricopeptide (TPR) repeat protein
LALQHSRDGNHLKAIDLLSNLMSAAESDRDRAAILLGEASCYSRVGDVAKSRKLLESAKGYAQVDRDILSQVALADASLYAQNREYKLACEKFVSIGAEYHDLLADNDDFALELDSRLACALVHAEKYSDAVGVFKRLFQREELEDKQRLQVFFGVALIHTGHTADAQSFLFAAAKGEDATLSKTALEYLTGIEKAQ